MMNTIEAMSGVSDGPRELLVSSGTDESQGVLVSVQDRGCGVSSEELGKSLHPEASTLRRIKGIVGLAISRSIIEAPTAGGNGL